MKANLSKVDISNGGWKRTVQNVGSIIALIALVMLMFTMEATQEKTIQVVKVTQDLFPNQLIVSTIVAPYDMKVSEYQNSANRYLLYEDVEKCIDMYSTIFVKSGNYIIENEFRETKPMKNAWLQDVAPGNLVITLPYNKGEAFGNILTPGDHLRVEVGYSKDVAGSSEFFSGVTTQRDSKPLFEKIKVIDLLNGSGNSIYDYYMDLLNLPIAQRDTLLRDESFLSNVSPSSMMLEVTPAQFVEYAKVKDLAGVKYTYGLHRREEGDIIVDQFQELSRQITSAQTQNTGGEQ